MTELYWDGSYEIAVRLMAAHPEVDIQDVTLRQIYDWTTSLPEFADDPALVNDDMLHAIYQEWFEEVHGL